MQMRQTVNANMSLPGYEDVIDIETVNSNFETVDKHLGLKADSDKGAHNIRYSRAQQAFEVYNPETEEWEAAGPTSVEEIEAIRADVTELNTSKAGRAVDAVAGNLAEVDDCGNLVDSGETVGGILDAAAADAQSKADLVLLEVQELEATKANRVIDAVSGNLATLDESGDPVDSGMSLEELQEKMSGQGALHIFSELDDVQMCTGTFINAGAGWNTFVFPSEFRDVPVVTAQIMGQEAIIMVQNVTTSGFQYQIRQLTAVLSGNVTASTANYFMADAAAATSVHTQRTVVTGVSNTLQVNGYSSTTAAAFQIAYQAILNGGVF